MVKRYATLIIAASLAAFSIPALATSPISGRATVVDGDTVAVEGTKERIRLYGVDTPEGQQTCNDAAGKRYLCEYKAAEFLANLIGRNGRLSCTEIDRDRYGRIVAECRRGNVVVNAELVRSGWALEYKAYSDGRYGGEEREARAAKIGLWQDTFVEPAKWRKGERLSTEVNMPTGPGNCQIKGNISGNGKIFHLPGSRAYPKTKIDEFAGERWFCSEAEAVAAGWRAVRG